MKELVPKGLEILTLASDAAILLILLGLLFFAVKRKGFSEYKIFAFARHHFTVLSFIVALTATLGSLYYSEIMGYSPCTLCWYQRIFMYPQVLFFATAFFFRREGYAVRFLAVSSLVMSGIGLLLAGYHYLAQIGAVSTTCSVVGYSASCSELFFVQYGYITIPMMAFTAFALLILLSSNALRKRSSF